MFDDLLDQAAELKARGEPFALATVVACRPPTSAKPGAKALIRRDGTVSGWVGGACAEPVVVREALKEYIAANNESRLSIVGIGRSDTGDTATRAEAILAEEIDPHEGWSPDRNKAGSSRKRGQ